MKSTMIMTCALLSASRSVGFVPRLIARTHTVLAAAAKLSFGPTESPPDGADATVLIGKTDILKSMALKQGLAENVVEAMLESGSTSTTFSASGKKISLCKIPDSVSRNSHPLSLHKIPSIVQSAAAKKGITHIQVGGVEHAAPVAAAIARAFPLYSRKTEGSNETSIVVSCLDANLNEISCPAEEPVAEAVRLACRLADLTPEELTTDAFAEECRMITDRFDSVTMTEIVGEELKEKGYGGLYGVGKAAECPPRLVILEYEPESDAKETVALVGKGIVYDTGGLSLKPRDGMCGMKHDMGGAAGMLGAFLAAVSLKVDKRVKLLLCLAENAIGPAAFRHDDILTLYSGKTVEVNNADAEGRLVLGDGVAHASKHYECDLIIDMATLTGAQLVTTGKVHAGILANTAGLEQRAVEAGLRSGDLVFPFLYAPELLKDEFDSKVADMKNSVKDRFNAQASCAGHFIESHLAADYKGGWLHVDMAGPSHDKDVRGTGYGVSFVLAMLQAPGFS
jgi:probable aminopeptidase NPEPL1